MKTRRRFHGRWMDNVFIERLWRSLKYECVFLNAFETGSEARFGIGHCIGYYNAARPLLVRRQDARRGLCYRAHDGEDGETGGINTNPIHLGQAAKLSRKTDTHFSPAAGTGLPRPSAWNPSPLR